MGWTTGGNQHLHLAAQPGSYYCLVRSTACACVKISWNSKKQYIICILPCDFDFDVIPQRRCCADSCWVNPRVTSEPKQLVCSSLWTVYTTSKSFGVDWRRSRVKTLPFVTARLPRGQKTRKVQFCVGCGFLFSSGVLMVDGRYHR